MRRILLELPSGAPTRAVSLWGEAPLELPTQEFDAVIRTLPSRDEVIASTLHVPDAIEGHCDLLNEWDPNLPARLCARQCKRQAPITLLEVLCWS